MGGLAPRLQPVAVRRMRSRSGVTLVELIISIMVFALLVGGIFQSVSATMSVSKQVVEVRGQSERLDGLQRLLRIFFLNMTGNTAVELKIRGTKTGDAIEVLMNPAPAVADFSTDASAAGALAISAQPNGKGAYTLAIANYSGRADVNQRNTQLDEVSWIPLVPDVRSVKWRFAESAEKGLQETWDSSNGRPVLADLELETAQGDKRHFQFYIPPAISTESLGVPQGDPEQEGGGGGRRRPPRPPLP